MSTTININEISRLDHTVHAYNRSGAPDGDRQKPLPVMPTDRVTLSKEAWGNNREEQGEAGLIDREQDLSTEEKQIVNDLKRRDTEVKAHEAAHMAAGSGVVQGGATFEYQSGPDGKMYAVGGEVKIDVSPQSTPEATIRKMQRIRAAALAPAQPSGTDRAVAAQASQLEAQARMEKSQGEQTGQNDKASPLHNRTGAAGSTGAPQGKGARIDLSV
ncbi:MAG: putative metalloprotease CJM1_0395 family protein [Desulfobacteraceae bacterium]|jgi:hypothetical protein